MTFGWSWNIHNNGTLCQYEKKSLRWNEFAISVSIRLRSIQTVDTRYSEFLSHILLLCLLHFQLPPQIPYCSLFAENARKCEKTRAILYGTWPTISCSFLTATADKCITLLGSRSRINNSPTAGSHICL